MKEKDYEIMEGVLRCFNRMEMEIGETDLIEGKNGYCTLAKR